ncbi:hypothetical protein BGX28_000137 [Mortierella sp. GBA30]|nr:hypothetical protein BGX28_000137 [Mortierella sp. GBA30]
MSTPNTSIALTTADPTSPPASISTATTPTTSAVSLPVTSSDPEPSSNPIQSSTTGRATRSRTTARATGTSGSNTGPTQGAGDGGGDDGNSNNDNKKPSLAGPIIGGIAGVLVLGFLVAVFVMRYKKKSRARKRRLEFLGDNQGGADASHRPAPAQNNAPSPSPLSGNRPLEMTVIAGGDGGVAALGAAAGHSHRANNDGYDYQQGYQQVPHGGYPEQYGNDQYDPYYAQRQQNQQQGYYVDPQQQGYYHDDHHYKNQFTPPVPINSNPSHGTGSPSMTHATVSPKSYPQPPPSTATGGQSSPDTPFHSSAPVPGGPSSYDKNTKIEGGYVGAQSAARNPQLVPEPQEGIKVPV